MNVTIIGGSGFIGTECIHLLSKQHTIKNIDKKQSTIHPSITSIADVRSIDNLRNAIPVNTDYLIVLAAEHQDNVEPITSYYDVNVQGAKNILTIAEEKNIRKIIFTSSVAVYGLNSNNADENSAIKPFNHYGKSKWEAEEVLRGWFNKSNTQKTLIIIRPTVVFGPNNRGNVYNLLKQIISGRFLMIGNGRNKKSMAYVENIATFIEYCIEKQFSAYNIFNYVDKPDFSTNELVNIVCKKINRDRRIIKIPYIAGYVSGICFDILGKILKKNFAISSIRIKKFCANTQFSAKLVEETGYKAPYTLHEALEKTIDSINANQELKN